MTRPVIALLLALLASPAWAQYEAEPYKPEESRAHLVGRVKAVGMPGPLPVGAVPRVVGRPSKPHPVVRCQGEAVKVAEVKR